MAWHLNQNQGKNAKHFINLISLFIMMFSLFTAEVAPPRLTKFMPLLTTKDSSSFHLSKGSCPTKVRPLSLLP